MDASGPQGDDDAGCTPRGEGLRGGHRVPRAAEPSGLADVDHQDVRHRNQKFGAGDERGGVDDKPRAAATGDVETVGGGDERDIALHQKGVGRPNPAHGGNIGGSQPVGRLG